MRSYILLFALLLTQLIYSTAFADPGKDESGKGWKNQKEQSKKAWKREREEAKDRREYKRESRKHFEEMEREERKHRNEMASERQKWGAETNKRDRYQPLNGERILEQEIDNVHRRTIDSIAEKTKPSRAWWKFLGSEE